MEIFYWDLRDFQGGFPDKRNFCSVQPFEMCIRDSLFTVTLRQIGAYIARAQLNDAIDVLVNGDEDSGSATNIGTADVNKRQNRKCSLTNRNYFVNIYYKKMCLYFVT